MIKEKLTTAIGILIVVFGAVALWFDKVPWIASVAFFILGVVFVLSKDPKWMKQLISKILTK